jgi:inorganic triphosphatase YgiF
LASQQFEIELKLELDPRDAPKLQRYCRKAFKSGQAQVLESVYFDTPERHLQRAGFALRVRHIGKRRIQTLKAAGEATTGLSVRPEWERNIKGNAPTLDRESDLLRPFIPQRALADLRPVFRTVVRRQLFEAVVHGSRIEVALDQGEVRSGRRKRALCEIELELKGGQPSSLFELARTIAAIVPVRLGVQSKAERGYALARAAKSQAVKADPVSLTMETTSAKALQAIANACLRHFRLNETILLTHDDAVALHQARVALRRLRSALTLFKPMLADERYDALRGEIKAMAVTLGAARNIDVLMTNLAPQRVSRVVRTARREAYARVRAALDSPRWRAAMLDIADWLSNGSWLTQPKHPSRRHEPISGRAVRILDRRFRRLKRRGRGLAHLDDATRHRIRIDAKKLRYAAEFFAALFPDKAAKRRKRFAAIIEAMLDSLGALNDLATASTLSGQLDLPTSAPMPARHRKRLLTKAERHYQALREGTPFWQ